MYGNLIVVWQNNFSLREFMIRTNPFLLELNLLQTLASILPKTDIILGKDKGNILLLKYILIYFQKDLIYAKTTNI